MSEAININNCDYTDSQDVTLFHLRGRNQKKQIKRIIIKGKLPHFWVRPEEVFNEDGRIKPEILIHKRITGIGKEGETLIGEKVINVMTKIPGDVGGGYNKKGIRDEFREHWEADILFPLRALYDLKIWSTIKWKWRGNIVTISPEDIEPCKEIPSNLRILKGDIEVDNTSTLPIRAEPSNPMNPLIMFSFIDNYTDAYTQFVLSLDGSKGIVDITYKAPKVVNKDTNEIYPWSGIRYKYQIRVHRKEKEMLQDIVNWIIMIDPDVLTAYNSNFDYGYFFGRCKRLKVNLYGLSPLGECRTTYKGVPICKGRTIMDYFAMYKFYQTHELDEWKLGYVSLLELGFGKKKYDYDSVGEYYRNDWKGCVEYNLLDTLIIDFMDKKLKLFDYYDERRKIAGIRLEDTMHPSRISDGILLHKANGKIVLPSKGDYEGKKKKISGATVFDPDPGLKYWVGIIDISGMYSANIINLNMGLDTYISNWWIEDYCEKFLLTREDAIQRLNLTEAPNGALFRTDKISFSVEVLNDLLEMRKDQKKEMNKFPKGSEQYTIWWTKQFTTKNITHTYFGTMAQKGARLYNRQVAGAVTSCGRFILEFIRDYLYSIGIKILYGDTDSVFIICPYKDALTNVNFCYMVEWSVNNKLKELNRHFRTKNKKWIVGFEKLFPTFIIGKEKKKYAGHLIFWDGKWVNIIPYVRGFAIRRSDASKVSKEFQEEVLVQVLTEKDPKFIRKYINVYYKKFMEGDFPLLDFGIPFGITKKLSDYGKKEKVMREIDGKRIVRYEQKETNIERVALARYCNKYLGTRFGQGSKPKKFYINPARIPEGYPPTGAIILESDKDLPERDRKGWLDAIDLEFTAEMILRKKVEKILIAVGLPWTYIEDGIRTGSVFDV